jgi:dihydrofolate synthase/folylpolyglutamate synthase
VTAGESGQWLRVRLQETCADAAAGASDGCEPMFCPLLGRYQLENAATAITAVQALRTRGYRVTDADLRRGFAGLRWPGRFEVLRRDPLIIADGAHTPYSMSQLCASLQEYFPDRRIHFVIGALRDKDVRGIIQEAARVAASLIFTDMDVRRAVPAEQLLATWQALNPSTTDPQSDPQNGRIYLQASTAVDVSSAIRQAQARADCNDVVCVAGSLYLAALAAERIEDL